MADNVTYTPGSGVSIAADELTDGTLGLVKVQIMKIMDGTLDSSNKLIVTAAGAAKVDGSAVTQPVSIGATVSENLAQVAGSTVATAATGIQKVGLTDGTGNAITSTSNAIDVNIKSGGGSGFSVVDEAAWTAATSAFVPAGGVFNDSAAALTSGQQGTLRLTTNRGLHVNLRTATGTEIGTSGSPVRVDPTGTTTQPVSAASLPLPTGAATAAKQPALGTAGSAAGDVITVQGIASMTALKVDPSGVTSPISAASLPLPSGASTAAKQPALGTAGSPSVDVLTVQGAASMTALKVDPSGVTSPVSIAGTVKTTQTPAASGGYSVSRLVSAASTNATSVKASAGQVYGFYLFNGAPYTVYLKLYNKASAPTVGTDTPFMTIPVPAGGGAVADWDSGIALGTGIAFAITKFVTDADNTAVVLNDLVVNLFYV